MEWKVKEGTLFDNNIEFGLRYLVFDSINHGIPCVGILFDGISISCDVYLTTLRREGG